MGIVEIVGYAGDGLIECTECVRKRGGRATEESLRTIAERLELSPIFDYNDFGPEGLTCDCGTEIQAPYCIKCGRAGWTEEPGYLCEYCDTDPKSNEDREDR